jgi:hypothetical protein
MVYGYEITDTAGNKKFVVEGCTYCHMSAGGQHELNCPYSPFFKDDPCHVSSGKLLWSQPIRRDK